MKSPKSSQPPSRRGKRQLMVFLDAKFAGAVRARAVKWERTAQEMLAAGLNLALAAHGRKAVFPVGHQRFMVRRKAVAVPRTADKTSLGRSGRASICGWFAVEDLSYASGVACELGSNLQDLSEGGLKLLMKRKAPPSAAAPPSPAAGKAARSAKGTRAKESAAA